MTIVFQCSIYGLACLASVILGYAEGAALPQGLTPPLAVMALIVTERWRTFGLSTLGANIWGIVALLVAGYEFMGDTLEARLLAGSHLLVYLMWIVLFHHKQAKHYWWMLTLSVLQVAVAAVLTKTPGFGLLLVLFLYLSMWTLAVFSLYQARQRFASPEQFAVLTAETPGVAVAEARPRLRTLRKGAASANKAKRTSMTRGAVHHDPDERWVNTRFVVGIFLTACLALMIGLFFFLLIPRLWVGRKHVFADEPDAPLPTLTGFTDEVQLGDMGQILESRQPVLNVRAYDNRTDEELDLEAYASRLGYSEPLFRGSVLQDYDRGRWQVGQRAEREFPNGNRQKSIELHRGAAPPRSVRQEIEMEPIGTRVVFAMHPLQMCRLTSRGKRRKVVMANVLTAVPQRPKPRDRSVIQYEAFSPLSPQTSPTAIAATADGRPMLDEWLERYLTYPRDLERLKALAHDVTEHEPGEPPGNPMQMARKLERYLGTSGEFTYTLDASIEDPTIDPVEDFLFNRKAGHCEYFGAAMALMLRSVGIPSRMVSGFKGCVQDEETGAYVVRQCHAHAWVEAYIDGGWVTLDATPASRSERARDLASQVLTWSDVKQFFSDMWSRNVIALSLKEQREQFYEPIKAWALAAWSWTKGRLEATLSVIRSPSKWFSWQGGLIAFVLLLLLGGLDWSLRKALARDSKFPGFLARFWRYVLNRLRGEASDQRSLIEFYDRFQNVMAEHGIVRNTAQTQQEFAVRVERALQEWLDEAEPELAKFPERLAAQFYRVRFGAQQLPAEEISGIDRELTQLERALASSNHS